MLPLANSRSNPFARIWLLTGMSKEAEGSLLKEQTVDVAI